MSVLRSRQTPFASTIIGSRYPALCDDPGHQLADAINIHFARWDRSHLHEFTLADGREIGFIDDDAPDTIDQDSVTASELGEDEEFGFVFDFGDNWEHRCRVEEVDVDPEELYGKLPESPVPIFGWGSIPDQYGRESDDG